MTRTLLERRTPVIARSLLALTVVAWALISWRECGSTPLRNWREADTQTIARHLAEPGASIFYPRIDWGGDGPGYVEAEFQLYTFLVALVLRVAGDVEWPGKLLSLVATLGTAALVFRELSRRHGDGPAALATSVLLASRGVIYVATSVQPEALCLLLTASAWFAWLEFVRSGSRRALGAYALFGALAMLVKPTAAQLGIASFLLLALQSRKLLRRPEVWLAWLSMLAPLALHLWHARNVYLEFGNTFGVLSGGDSKMPRFEQLLSPRVLFAAAKNVVLYGTGPLGAALIAVAFGMRRGVPLLLALLTSNAIWTLLALRYTSDAAGNHYHLVAALTAAHATALVAEAAWQSRYKLGLSLVFGVVALAALASGIRQRMTTHPDPWDEPAVAAARALSRVSAPGDLVVVRSVQSSYDPRWRTPNNFQDPRVFYLSKTHGWAVGLDDAEVASVSEPVKRGARFYVETVPRPPAPALDAWLAARARLVHTSEFGGKLFAFDNAAADLD